MANSAAPGSRLPCLGLMIAPSWPAAIASRPPAVEGLARYSIRSLSPRRPRDHGPPSARRRCPASASPARRRHRAGLRRTPGRGQPAASGDEPLVGAGPGDPAAHRELQADMPRALTASPRALAAVTLVGGPAVHLGRLDDPRPRRLRRLRRLSLGSLGLGCRLRGLGLPLPPGD